MESFTKRLFRSNKEISLFTLGSVIYNSLLSVLGIIILFFLSPSEVGLWNSLLILQPYLFFFQLGVFNGLNRELPFLMGCDRKDEALDLVAIAWKFSKLLALISFVSTIFITLWFAANSEDAFFIVGCLGVGVQISAEYLINFILVTYRAKEHFLNLSKVYFVQSILLVLTIPVIVYFGYYGFVLRTIFLSVVMFLLLYKYKPLTFDRLVKKNLIIHLIKVGLPLFSLGYIMGLTKSFSRIIILLLGDTRMVGLYAPSLAVIWGVGMIPVALGQYLYPRLSYLWGKHGQKEILWSKVWQFAIGSLLISVPIVIIGWFSLPFLIQKYLPSYIEGIIPAQISLFSGAFEGAMIGVNVLNSMKAYKWLVILTASKILLFFILQYIIAQYFPILIGISVGYLIASFLYLMFGMLISFLATHNIFIK